MTDLPLAELEVLWAAEGATLRAECAAEKEYTALLCDLMAVETAHKAHARARGHWGLYLTDSNADHENSEHEVAGSVAYWKAMYRSAACSAGSLAEEYGLDINKLVGYGVY